MVRLTNRKSIEKNRLLYDPAILEELVDEHGTPANIKLAIKTTAKQYEIRTAMRYWFGGQVTYRTSDRIWSNCEAVGNGEWKLTDDDELAYNDGGSE